MRKLHVLFCLALTLLLATPLAAGEKKLLHCFAFTVVGTASAADWQAFAKATDELSGKIPGLTRVWHGKLRQPLNAGGPPRQHGVCMEMNDEATFKTYGTHAAHNAWAEVYSKVRQPGTTTFQILGQ